MTITKIQEENKLTLKLTGWLDTTTVNALASEVDAIESAESIVFDFNELEYISSAGLRQVAAAAKKAKAMDADFSITGAGKDVMAVFKLTGLDKKFHVTPKE